jgi:hypothetical protein
VIVAVPAATPVTTPVEAFTVAIPVLPDVHVPPLVPFDVNVVVPPEQIACVPLSVPALDAAVTVTVRVAVEAAHPPAAAIVYVIVAVPAATPVTTPVELFTVAIDVLPDVHEPPVLPSVVNVVVPVPQMACVPDNVPAVAQGRNTSKMAPLVAVPDIVTDALPVDPAVGIMAHAEPMDASSLSFEKSSSSSFNVAGSVAPQLEYVKSLAAMASIITAELVVVVVIAVAVAVPAVVRFKVCGSTSNGPPAVPSAFNPPVDVAPEKATMEPIVKSDLPFGSVKA